MGSAQLGLSAEKKTQKEGRAVKKVKQIVKQNGIMTYGMKSKNHNLKLNHGAGDEIRTRDLLLGKQTLYH